MANIVHPKCKACNLPINERKQLDRDLLRGVPITTLSQRYNLSRDVLYRHKNNHLGAAAALGVRRAAENHGTRLLEDLDELVITARRILREADEDGHRKTALAAVKEVRASIVAIAQISHAIWQQQQQDATIIEVTEQDEQSRRWFAEGFASLTENEQQTYRKLVLKMVGGIGGHSSDFDPEVKDYTTQGEKINTNPLEQSETEFEDNLSTRPRRTRFK